MLKGFEVDLEQCSDSRQSLAHLVEKCAGFQVVLWAQPLVFQLALQVAPQDFDKVEVWRIRRPEEKQQATLLPELSTLLNTLCNVSRCVVQHHNRWTLQAPGQAFQRLDNEARINVFGRGLEAARVGAARVGAARVGAARVSARQQGKTVESHSLVAGQEHFFILELPRVGHTGHTRLQRNAAFITIIQVDPASLAHRFQYLQAFDFERVNFRMGFAAGTFSHSFIDTTVFFTKRLNVIWQKLLSNTCSSSARATLNRCRCSATLALTVSTSASCKIALRPRPGRVCKPAMP